MRRQQSEALAMLVHEETEATCSEIFVHGSDVEETSHAPR